MLRVLLSLTDGFIAHGVLRLGPKRRVMSAISQLAVKQAIVTLGFVSCITAALDASVSPSSLGSEKRTLIMIDRTNKSDRLPSATSTSSSSSSSDATTRRVEMGPPVGCDPAFCLAANPEHAAIYKRCTT